MIRETREHNEKYEIETENRNKEQRMEAKIRGI